MRRELVMLVAAGLVVSPLACSGDDNGGGTVPTPTTVAPITDAPTTMVADLPGPDEDGFPAGEPVDLVYITDSGRTNVDQRYADLAAQALDREVRLRPVDPNPLSIRTTYAEQVAEAEIIVFYFNPGAFEDDMPEPNIDAGCFDSLDALEDPNYSGPAWTPGTKWEPAPVVPTAEDWQPYRDWLSDVYDAIWEVRQGRPVVLRAHDIYNPWFAPWTELGVEAECTAIWEGQTQAIREAAEANGAVFVSFFDLFNGPDHDEDPRAKGWIGDDGMHASVDGGAAAAQALAAVGFELSETPG
jgi:hypothetical protein